MSLTDDAKNKAENLKGQAKETVGEKTNDPELANEGRKDQVVSELKGVGNDLKDAAQKVKDAVSH
jgi:uncharacterized protein YjbJ (UPF0337 family)